MEEPNSDSGSRTFDDLIEYNQSVTKLLFGSQIESKLITAKSRFIKDDSISNNRSFPSLISDMKLDSISNSGQTLSSAVVDNRQKPAIKPILPLVLQEHILRANQFQTSNKDADNSKAISLRNQDMTLNVQTCISSLIHQHMPHLIRKEKPICRPWKLFRMISGHGGWVHSLDVDPANKWFASGSRDGLIKIWDLASGKLRLTLTGHISAVRGLAISPRHPYLFSCGDDKMVKCWDLECNQVVRSYHGHLSGVYCLSLHPTENILITGGRDAAARVWDMRTKEQIHCLTGHRDTVGSLLCQADSPQLITGSYDTTIRLWDLKMARTVHTLTHHKKSVRALVMNHDKSSFISGAIDNLKQWTYPGGQFVKNLSGHDSIINSLAVNRGNVLVSGADNGTIFLWDWDTGYNFQRLASPPQKGSIESEAGILAMTFDKTGTRLITGETDKTIKMYREDPNFDDKIDLKPKLAIK